jgi:ketosteroid isomerase-like protein
MGFVQQLTVNKSALVVSIVTPIAYHAVLYMSGTVMKEGELFDYSREWLAAWTGNQPEKLIAFYHPDALYVDPAHKEGLKGHAEIRPYFERLLRAYHDWVWTPVEVFPIETGGIVKWECTIRVGSEEIHETGIDIVELKDKKIIRNEVYFDRTRLLAAVERRQQIERLRV